MACSLQKAPTENNAWIDHCKKGKANDHPVMFDEAIYLHQFTVSDAFVQIEVFEQFLDASRAGGCLCDLSNIPAPFRTGSAHGKGLGSRRSPVLFGS
ncbi:hypothetical protein [Brevibacillus sp. FIR094]|uniref:hypothetical protein n=1 Tax=Brevibacillus sp. FIR094 TaxID=3134809 RepID=UPI003D1987BE